MYTMSAFLETVLFLHRFLSSSTAIIFFTLFSYILRAQIVSLDECVQHNQHMKKNKHMIAFLCTQKKENNLNMNSWKFRFQFISDLLCCR